jgi:hypothetical protein
MSATPRPGHYTGQPRDLIATPEQRKADAEAALRNYLADPTPENREVVDALQASEERMAAMIARREEEQ